MTDFVSAPFYDRFHESWYIPKLRRNLSSLLAGAKRSILEVGAGTGLVTAALAEVTPAEIFALEPSAAMRAVLRRSARTGRPAGPATSTGSPKAPRSSARSSSPAAPTTRHQTCSGMNWRPRASPRPEAPEISSPGAGPEADGSSRGRSCVLAPYRASRPPRRRRPARASSGDERRASARRAGSSPRGSGSPRSSQRPSGQPILRHRSRATRCPQTLRPDDHEDSGQMSTTCATRCPQKPLSSGYCCGGPSPRPGAP